MQQIASILIANRGEIASRIIRTCRKLGIRSIAVYADPDAGAPFVEEADVAVALGGQTPTESYLAVDKLLAAAAQTGAHAIHPGYGFLAENAEFARACAAAGLIFIGPNPEAIAAMGSKSAAKALMQQHAVPVIPGFQSAGQDPDTFRAEADKIGYPVLLKAVAGGGGKGMRIVAEASDFDAAFAAAASEAQSAFGDAQLLLEKYFSKVRHIEFQVFGDQHGNVIHLLERECSIQRRYQKVLEESPSPALDPDLRAEMGAAALAATRALSYDNAGTVEFILSEEGDFYFLEVNTRLQVEHPVTEMITGLDLVEMQINIAEGQPIQLQQADINARGYALECRLYAEDARQNFMPQTGKVLQLHWPEIEGLRIESGIATGSEVSVYFDPMLAKIVVWAENRATAHRKMEFVLREMRCLGLTTNRAFLLALLRDPDIRAGRYNTHFLNSWTAPEMASTFSRNHAMLAATLAGWQERAQARTVLAHLPSGWRNSFSAPQFTDFNTDDGTIRVTYRFQDGQFEMGIGEEKYTVVLASASAGQLQLRINELRHKVDLVRSGKQYWLQADGADFQLELADRFPSQEAEGQENDYRAPMPAQVVKVLVAPGDQVAAETGLLVLSSMKMENTIRAATAGTVTEILVTAGDNIETGTEMLVFAAEEKG